MPAHKRSGLLRLILIGLLILVMILTAYKDWRLTGDAPNPLFHLLVPPVDILASDRRSSGAICLEQGSHSRI